MPRNENSFSVGGPVDTIQFIPSLDGQLMRFAIQSRPEPNRTLGSVKDHGAERSIGRQAPVTVGINLRRVRLLAGLYVKSIGLRGGAFRDAVQADRRRRPCALGSPDI